MTARRVLRALFWCLAVFDVSYIAGYVVRDALDRHQAEVWHDADA